MSEPQKDLWVQQVFQVPPGVFSASPQAPKGRNGPGTIRPERLKAQIADAEDAAKTVLEQYQAAKVGADTGVAGNVEDPGPRVQKAVASLHKGAEVATRALKGGDLATAAKFAAALSAEASTARKLVTDFAVAVDHGAAGGRIQFARTPWGAISLPYEVSAKPALLIVPLSKTLEFEKAAIAKHQAQVKALEDATKSIAEFIAAPGKAVIEINHFASEAAVNWAEHSDTATLLTKFAKLYRKTLTSLLEHARNELDAALQLANADDLRAQAAELRKRAEEMERWVDFGLELLKGGAKIAIGGEEEAMGAAVDIVGGLIKLFHGNKIAERAEEMEAEAAKLTRSALLKNVANAAQAIQDAADQLGELEPVISSSGHSAERKTRRATSQYDKDCAKDPKCKFNFKAVAHAKKAATYTSQAADEWARVWAGADALLESVRTALSETNYLPFNGEVLTKIRADIDKNAKMPASAQADARQKLHQLDVLFDTAMAGLQQARQPPPDE